MCITNIGESIIHSSYIWWFLEMKKKIYIIILLYLSLGKNKKAERLMAQLITLSSFKFNCISFSLNIWNIFGISLQSLLSLHYPFSTSDRKWHLVDRCVLYAWCLDIQALNLHVFFLSIWNTFRISLQSLLSLYCPFSASGRKWHLVGRCVLYA